MKPVTRYQDLTAIADWQGFPMGFIEAEIMLGYIEGHGYQLVRDDSFTMYRRDLTESESGQSAYEPYTVRDALEFCISMNEDLRDQERRKADPDTNRITKLDEDASILIELRERYEAFNPYFTYLDTLRESGITNMLGAVPYLIEEFPELSRNHARTILSNWMKRKGAQNHESD